LLWSWRIMRQKRPGRPPLDASGIPSAGVYLKLPARDFDIADKIRKKNRESIQDVLRRGLKRVIDDERGGRI
jgi:hypothetical protein